MNQTMTLNMMIPLLKVESVSKWCGSLILTVLFFAPLGAQFEFDVMIPGTPFVDDDFVKYDTEGSIVSGGSSACVDKMSDDGGNAHPPSIVSSLSSQAPPLQPTKKTQKRRTSWSSYLNKNNRVNPKYVEQALRLQNPSAATLHSGSPRGASTPSVGSGGQGSSKDSGIDENEPDPNPVIIPSFDSCIRVTQLQ
jgi:hypothetical protein